MEDKLLSKEISEEKLGVSNDLRHTANSWQNRTFDLFKPHDLSAIDNVPEKKKCPDVNSVFNHTAKSSATSIEQAITKTIQQIIQKIISKKKTSSGCDSSYRSKKSINDVRKLFQESRKPRC